MPTQALRTIGVNVKNPALAQVASKAVSSGNTCQNDLNQIRNSAKVYHIVMKYVFLAIFVLFAAQPLQASSCDMQSSQGTSHSGHDMQDGPMAEGDGAGMDCCDHDPSVPSDNCDSMSHCGACTTAVVAINSSTVNVIFSLNCRQYLAGTGEPLSRFSPPPFRPPIS